MKFLASTFLVLFITFLSVPSLVTLIEKRADISLIYDLSEEDNQKDSEVIKEFKLDYAFKNQFEFVVFKSFHSKKINSENISKHDNVSLEIFIPPPEVI